MINLVIVELNGENILAFDIINLFCKSIEEGFVVTVLVAVAWGWSLTHIDFPMKYMVIPFAVTLLHIYCLVIELSN